LPSFHLVLLKLTLFFYCDTISRKGSPIKSSVPNKKKTPWNDYSKSSQNFARKAPLKKESLETTQKNEIKTLFINWFRGCRALEGHIMTKQDVINNVLRKLDSKQDKIFTKAMDELKNEGLIEVQEDGVTLVLTQKGADFI